MAETQVLFIYVGVFRDIGKSHIGLGISAKSTKVEIGLTRMELPRGSSQASSYDSMNLNKTLIYDDLDIDL